MSVDFAIGVEIGLLIGFLFGWWRGDRHGRYDVARRWAEAEWDKTEKEKNR